LSCGTGNIGWVSAFYYNAFNRLFNHTHDGVSMFRALVLPCYLLALFVILSSVGGCGHRTRTLRPAQVPPLGVLPPEAVTPVPAVYQPDYILGVEDILDIHVWKNDALSRVVLIRPDGKISLPLIGDVPAAGLTPSQLHDAIKTRLMAYQETPEVSVILKEIGSFAVFVLGEVEHPGKLQLRSQITLLQALALVGGFTRFADQDNILLLRKQGTGEVRMRIRYRDIITGRYPEHNVQLQRDDTLVIP